MINCDACGNPKEICVCSEHEGFAIKRYLVFAGEDFYALGGWGDFCGDFDTEDEAFKAALDVPNSEWRHIVDTKTGKIIASDVGNSTPTFSLNGRRVSKGAQSNG